MSLSKGGRHKIDIDCKEICVLKIKIWPTIDTTHLQMFTYADFPLRVPHILTLKEKTCVDQISIPEVETI